MATRGRFEVRSTDKGWEKLRQVARALKGGDSFAKVGILENALTPEDAAGQKLPFTMASLAAIHEFGSRDGRIPERSFIRGGLTAERARLQRIARKVAKGIYEGKLDIEQGLGLLGLEGAQVVRRFVTTGPQVPPPNAASTLKAKTRKGAWKGPANDASKIRTLIDSGRMVGSVTWAVVVKGVQRSIEPVKGGA
jgi:phage gpG-like protein